MHTLLNHLESISVAYMRDALDDDVVESSFKDVMLEWRHRLTPYTELVDIEKHNVRNNGTWQPFYDVTKEWDAKRRFKLNPQPAKRPGWIGWRKDN